MKIQTIITAFVVAPLFSIVSAISTPDAQYKIDTTQLPNISKSLAALNQWSGSLSVGTDKSLFFWYIQASNPASNNLIFWYNGGPGCSSMQGLFDENGPYVAGKDGKSFDLNPNSWHNIGHIVYVDQPFGTGFSHDNVTVPDEDFVGSTMVDFYQKFFDVFPSLKSKNMYLAGESFAGRYIPYFAKHVLDFNDANKANPINLKSVVIGNGMYDNFVNTDLVNMIPFWKKNLWMIANNQTWLSTVESMAQKAKTMPNCANGMSDSETSDACNQLLDEFYSLIQLPTVFPLPLSCVDQSGNPIYYNPYNINSKDCGIAQQDLGVTQAPFSAYLNKPEVQKALHAEVQVFKVCAVLPGGLYSVDPSLLPKFFMGSLVDRGLKVFLYSGLGDAVVSHTTTEATIRQLTWRRQKGFSFSRMSKATMTPILIGRPLKQTGSYHSENGLTYVTFNNAGHMVPRDDPVSALWMMNKLVLI